MEDGCNDERQYDRMKFLKKILCVTVCISMILLCPPETVQAITNASIQEKEKEIDPIALEMNARADVLHQLNAQLAFSKQAIELHSMLGLPPLPPLCEFIKEINNIVNKYI